MTTQKTQTTLAVVPTLGDDKALAAELLKRFSDAQLGMRKITVLGLLAWEIKEKLKHGQFGTWLQAYAPKLCRLDSKTNHPKPSNSLTTYMTVTSGVLKATGYTVAKYLDFVSNSLHEGICHGGKYLLLPDKKLPKEVRAIKEQICALVDGKTQRQLFLEFKQEEDGKPKVGRLKGQGGKSGPISLSEQAELLKTVAASDWAEIAQSLSGYKDKFLVLTDSDIQAQISTLEQALKARSAWLKQPFNARDPKAIAALF